jgi:hypothetical protein
VTHGNRLVYRERWAIASHLFGEISETEPSRDLVFVQLVGDFIQDSLHSLFPFWIHTPVLAFLGDSVRNGRCD